MKNLFVPYNLAVKAKEKGFDEGCLAYYSRYHNSPTDIIIVPQTEGTKISWMTNDKDLSKVFTAPTYQQLVDWFREKQQLKISESEAGQHENAFCILGSGIDGKETFAGNSYYEALEYALGVAFNII